MDMKQEIKLPSMRFSRKPKTVESGPAARAETKMSDVVGLDIGAASVVAARILNNGSTELVQIAREPMGPGIIDRGEVRDPVALGALLNGFFERNGLSKRNVRLGLANSRIGVRVIEISGIDDDSQLENAIAFRAHEMLAVPIDEALIDHRVLSVERDEHGSVTRRVLVVVAYRESVDRYLAAADAAKLHITGVDLEAFALTRAASAPTTAGAAAEAAVVAVCIGHERTILAISDGEVCSFTRVLDWGGGELTAAIAQALKISPAEADDVKRSLSLERDAEAPPGVTPVRVEEARDAWRFALQALTREILSSLRFYQSQQESLPIAELLVSGGTADTLGFAAELERQLGVPVRTADPLGRVVVADGVEVPEGAGSLSVAIGLGIED